MGGAGASGRDWIVNAFKWARAACPNAILILNDYNNIEYGSDNSHTIDIVTSIKAVGAPIAADRCEAPRDDEAHAVPRAADVVSSAGRAQGYARSTKDAGFVTS